MKSSSKDRLARVAQNLLFVVYLAWVAAVVYWATLDGGLWDLIADAISFNGSYYVVLCLFLCILVAIVPPILLQTLADPWLTRAEGWTLARRECDFCEGRHQNGLVFASRCKLTMCEACLSLGTAVFRDAGEPTSDKVRTCSYCRRESTDLHMAGAGGTHIVCRSCIEALGRHPEANTNTPPPLRFDDLESDVQSMLRNEVPEVMRSEVHVHAISRIPGQGTMVVVGSDSPHIDPVAAVIGEQGSRIQQIVQALDGERVTVVPWSERPEELVAEAVGIQLEDHFVAEGARVVLVPYDEAAPGDAPYRSHTSWLDDRDMTVFQLAADVSGYSISIVRAPEYAAHGREAAAFHELRPRTANESVLSALLHRDGSPRVQPPPRHGRPKPAHGLGDQAYLVGRERRRSTCSVRALVQPHAPALSLRRLDTENSPSSGGWA